MTSEPAGRVHHDAITDVPGLKVGHWSDFAAAKGCTVVLCEKGAVAAIDIRGGAASTRATDSMRSGMLVQEAQGVVLTGGSAYGLDAVGGVMRWCDERGIGFEVGGTRVPIIAGAVIFDLSIGRADIRPGVEAGYAAAENATDGPVAEGSIGAGTGATFAKALGGDLRLKGGIGSASEALSDGFVVGAIVVVNAIGSVVDSSTGRIVGGPRGEAGEFLDARAILNGPVHVEEGASTTPAVVATNATLTMVQTARLATSAHDGMARAIVPAHTSGDGDLVFGLATGDLDLAAPMDQVRLELAAALAVERAIVKAVRSATSLAGTPSLTDWLQTKDRS